MPDRRLRVPAHVACRVVDGAAVLFNAESGQYFALDDVGTRVWSLLVTSVDLSSVYDALLADFDVAPDVLRRDLDALVESLRSRGLVQIEVG
jgi:PqqD family protein of HPr-rel-A system